jgi:hypothetical protein
MNQIGIICLLVILVAIIGIYIYLHKSCIYNGGDELSSESRREYYTAIPIVLGQNTYRSKSHLYKVYPLCCKECELHADKLKKLYLSKSMHGTPRVVSTYIMERPPHNGVGGTPYKYLVIEMERIIPIWELKPGSLKTESLSELKNAANDLRPSHLGLDNLAYNPRTEKIELVDLDHCGMPSSSAAQKSPFMSKGSIILYLDPRLFQNQDYYHKWYKEIATS